MAIAYIAWRSQLANLGDTLASLSFLSVAVAGSTLSLSLLFAALRMQFAAHDLGQKLSYRDSLAAFAVGAIGGYIAFQLIGQIAARGSVFQRRGSSAEAAAAVTLYERVVATAVSMGFAVCGAFYLFGSVGINLKAGGDNLFTVIIGLTATCAAVAIFAWPDLIRRYVAPLVGRKTFVQTLRIAGVTLLIQGCTLVAYVVLIGHLAPTIAVAKIAAASTIVMFAASLPISFAGWGIRELSAVSALGTIGVEPQAAIIASVLVGLFSLAAVGFIGAWAAIITFGTSPPGEKHISSAANRASLQSRALEIALALLATMLVLFQVQVPLERGWVNLSPADLPAAICGLLAIFHLVRQPRAALTPPFLFSALGSALVLIGYLHGVLSFGASEWASARAIGWLALLSYAAVGAVIGRAHEMGGARRLATTLTVSATTIVMLSLLFGLTEPESTRVAGFSGNSNALGFQLLICLGIGFTFLRGKPSWQLTALVLVTGIITTRSLSSIGGLGIMSLAAWIMISRPRPALVLVIVVTVTAAVVSVMFFLRTGAEFDSSNAERLSTITKAVRLFVSHPIFGAGLGYFYEHFHRADGTALVIHSTPMWVLAEFGLTGALAMIAFAIFLLRHLTTASGGMLMFALTLIVFASVGLVHDMFYQRVFWLALGTAVSLIPQKVPLPAPVC